MPTGKPRPAAISRSSISAPCRASRGNNSISRTGLRIAGRASFEYWHKRLTDAGVKVGEIVERDGRLTLDFEDPEGQRLSFVDDGGKGEAHPWEKSPVPAEHQIRGLGPITLTVPSLLTTKVVLENVMFMKKVREYPYPDDAEGHRPCL